jgi:hypothetical protein
VVIEFLPAIEPGLGGREFFNELQLRMETAGNKLIDEAVARDPSLAPIVEANRKLPSKAKAASKA